MYEDGYTPLPAHHTATLTRRCRQVFHKLLPPTSLNGARGEGTSEPRLCHSQQLCSVGQRLLRSSPRHLCLIRRIVFKVHIAQMEDGSYYPEHSIHIVLLQADDAHCLKGIAERGGGGGGRRFWWAPCTWGGKSGRGGCTRLPGTPTPLT